ncbi:ComEA family DNA-binding protein [Frondihabitans peucedani]|uniref:Helix-hairpin-helix DNA-binding motif class 1 domain-containing protein n=1 Tax=Frondihabitans peucedani TaxID=598626 RepID=A0ABP8DYB2_9MICO
MPLADPPLTAPTSLDPAPVPAPAPAAGSSREADFREPGSAPRWRVGVGAVVVVVLVLIALGVVLSAVASADESVGAVAAVPSAGGASASASESQRVVVSGASGETATPSSGGVFVHVLGRVSHPGLYEVDPGARAVDVVAAAGGFAAEADQGALNLARPVADGEQIVVPRQGETAAPSPASSSAGSPGAPSAAAAPVDLNTADDTALQTLTGVGPATAKAILAWRDEHGRFEAVDDLLDVPGIGPKKLDSLRDSLRVG